MCAPCCLAGQCLVGGWQPGWVKAQPGSELAVPDVLPALLQWCYTGRLTIPADALLACQAACQDIGVQELSEDLLSRIAGGSLCKPV